MVSAGEARSPTHHRSAVWLRHQGAREAASPSWTPAPPPACTSKPRHRPGRAVVSYRRIFGAHDSLPTSPRGRGRAPIRAGNWRRPRAWRLQARRVKRASARSGRTRTCEDVADGGDDPDAIPVGEGAPDDGGCDGDHLIHQDQVSGKGCEVRPRADKACHAPEDLAVMPHARPTETRVDQGVCRALDKDEDGDRGRSRGLLVRELMRRREVRRYGRSLLVERVSILVSEGLERCSVCLLTGDDVDVPHVIGQAEPG